MGIPAITSLIETHERHRITDHPFVRGDQIQLDSTVVDARSNPTSLIREGLVVVLVDADDNYILADTAGGDRNASASVSAAETADGDWQNTTITVTVDGGRSFDIVLGGADDTDAEVVTALNANAVFAAHCVADVSGARVRIRTREAGAHKHLLVSGSVASMFGAAGTADAGADADYRVIEKHLDMRDPISGTAVDSPAESSIVGHYDESALSSLSAEARATLSRRGSIFG